MGCQPFSLFYLVSLYRLSQKLTPVESILEMAPTGVPVSGFDFVRCLFGVNLLLTGSDC
jgi:hypothetical protein